MNNGKIFVSLLVVSGFIYERMLVSVIEKRKEKKVDHDKLLYAF